MPRLILALSITLLFARAATADPISLSGSGAVLSAGSASDASVLGHSIAVNWWYPNAGTSIFSRTVVVTDPGVEIPLVASV